jgi:hypothetical protein
LRHLLIREGTQLALSNEASKINKLNGIIRYCSNAMLKDQ